MKKLNFNLLIVIIFILGSIVRLLGIFIPLYDDSAGIASITMFHDKNLLNFLNNPHPPMLNWVFGGLSKLTGTSQIGLRAIPIGISFILLIFLIKFARLLHKDNRIIFWVILSSFFTYLSFVSSITFDADGSILALFGLLTFYYLYKYTLTTKSHLIFLINLFFALALLTKLRAVVIVPPLVIWLLYTNGLKKGLKISFFCLIPGVLFFLMIIFFIVLNNPHIYMAVFKNIFLHTLPGDYDISAKIKNPLLFLNLFIALSPFYICSIFSTFKNKQRNQYFILIWALVPLTILSIFLPSTLAANYPRYFSILFPPLLLLASLALTNLYLSNKEIWLTLITSAFFGGWLYLLNNTFAKTFWYLVDSAGPVIKISQGIMFLAYFVFILLILCWFIIKKYQRIFIVSLLSLGLGFNIFLISEAVFDDSYIQILSDVDSYLKQNKFKGPIFSWNEDISYYFDKKGPNIDTFSKNVIPYANLIGYNSKGYIDMDIPIKKLEFFLQKGGTVILLNYPYKYFAKHMIINNEKMKLVESLCDFKKVFKRPHAAVFIYDCNP